MKKSGWIAIRCDRGEKVVYFRAAKARGMTLSAFTRAVLDKAALEVLSNYLKMARRHCRRNHRSAHASCNTPR